MMMKKWYVVCQSRPEGSPDFNHNADCEFFRGPMGEEEAKEYAEQQDRWWKDKGKAFSYYCTQEQVYPG